VTCFESIRVLERYFDFTLLQALRYN